MSSEKVYIDSNIFIYYILKDPERYACCKALLKKVQSGRINAVCSLLVLCEVNYNVTKYLGKSDSKLAMNALLSLPIKYEDIDMSVFIDATLKLGESKLKIFDAIHLATSLTNSANVIYSYDKDFDNLLKIKRVEP